MGMVEMAKKIKEIHPNEVILYKSGAFYKALGKDSYILSSIFGYQIKIIDQNVASCGFPLNSVMRIRSKLEERKINYMLVDQRNNYDVDVIEDFKNLNNYADEFKNAYSRVKNKKKIDRLAEDLNYMLDRPNFKEIIRKIEDVLDENREI